MDDILDKLKRLSERGNGGEKENALRILQKLLRKRGVKLEDFLQNKQNEKKEYCFKYKTKYEHTLLKQICCMVLNENKITVYKRYRKNEIGIILTEIQFIEISTFYEILVPQFQKEIDITLKAFLIKNELFSKKDDDNKNDKEISLQEKMKIWARMSSIEKTELHKQLKEKN